MKNIFFLIISGSFIFLPIDVFGEERNLIKLDVTGDCARCNLESVNLSEKDLSGADLTRANLWDADLSGTNLSGAELELVSAEKREYRLREALVRHAETEREIFDFVLIDCPPSLGLLTLNSLVASDAVLVPLQCEFYSLEGLSMLLNTIERVRRVFNPSLEIQGVVLTMADQRNNLTEQVAADVREHLGEKVYETVIPRNVRVSEAPSHGLPALVYDLRCAGSQAYIHLAGEVIRRERSIAK